MHGIDFTGILFIGTLLFGDIFDRSCLHWLLLSALAIASCSSRGISLRWIRRRILNFLILSRTFDFTTEMRRWYSHWRSVWFRNALRWCFHVLSVCKCHIRCQSLGARVRSAELRSRGTWTSCILPSARMAEDSRHVVVIPKSVSGIIGRVTEYCPTSTGFENPASRETSPRNLKSIELFLLCTERGRVSGRKVQTNLMYLAW